MSAQAPDNHLWFHMKLYYCKGFQVLTTIELEHFLPYRLSVLSNRISQDIAQLYREKHGISVTEWRIIAVLGRKPGLSARGLVERTAMDKVAVSRAVTALAERGLLIRDTHDDDRRRSVLRLSPAGQAIHEDVAPKALAYEKRLLAALSPAERTALNQLLKRIEEIERKVRLV